MSNYKFSVRDEPTPLSSTEYKQAYELEKSYQSSLTGFKQFYGTIWLDAVMLAIAGTYFKTLTGTFAIGLAVVTFVIGCCILLASICVSISPA